MTISTQPHMDTDSHDYMAAMAALMAEALDSPDGMRALAAAIAPPIEQEIERKIVTPMLLTDDALAEAMSFLEDREITVKTIGMRGRRFKDLKGWDLDPQTKLELREKGFIKVYGGADILTTSSMPLNEVLILPDEEVGKYPIREKLTTDPIDEKRRFKTGWLAWMEVGMGITRPDLMAKIVILP